MGYGKILKEERERQGYSLETVEEETKIRKAYIKALENEETSLLPPRVYAIGFLKLYCSFLKLDSEEMVNEFKLQAYGAEEEEEELQMPTTKNSEFKLPGNFNLKNILAAAIFLVLVIWAGNSLVGYFANQGIDEQTPPSPPTVTEQQPQENVKPSHPQVVVKQAEVVITATQRCWLRVVVDDQQQYEGTLLPGQTKSFAGKQSVVVRAGNAGGINITYNNKDLGPMGAASDVLEKVYTVEK